MFQLRLMYTDDCRVWHKSVSSVLTVTSTGTGIHIFIIHKLLYREAMTLNCTSTT